MRMWNYYTPSIGKCKSQMRLPFRLETLPDFRVDNRTCFPYNESREENRQSREQAERPFMRKVRAPQGKDNG